MRGPILTAVLGGVTLLSLSSCGGAHLEPVPPAYRTGFTGIWNLNRDLSSRMEAPGTAGSPRDRGDDGRGGIGRGGIGGRGGFGGRGGEFGGRDGDEGGRGGRGRGFDRVAMRETMRLLAPPNRMEISVRDSAVSIETGRRTDEKITLPLDDQSVETPLPDDHKLKMKARFDPKDDVLVIERSVSGGGSLVETYTLTPHSDRIIVQVKLKGGPGGGRTLRRVYDRAPDVGSSGRP